jgi:hypothetical protein
MLGRGSNLIVPDEGVDGLVISLSQKSLVRLRDALGRQGPGRGGAAPEEPLRPGGGGRALGLRVPGGDPGQRRGRPQDERGRHGRLDLRRRRRGALMAPDGAVSTVPRSAMNVDYRHCAELREAIALGAVLRPDVEVRRRRVGRQIDDYRRKRHESQPREPSAGCIFKNPPGASAGRLIEESGLKGTRVGGAEVSRVHANFVVNRGTPRARTSSSWFAGCGRRPPGQGRRPRARGAPLRQGMEGRPVNGPVIAVFAGGTSAEREVSTGSGARVRARPGAHRSRRGCSMSRRTPFPAAMTRRGTSSSPRSTAPSARTGACRACWTPPAGPTRAAARLERADDGQGAHQGGRGRPGGARGRRDRV